MQRHSRIVALAAALILGACASKNPTPAPTPIDTSPIKAQEQTAAQRAQIRADLAAGYYERGQMDVALEELGAAARLDPNNARIYNVYGLVYTAMGDAAKAEDNYRRALALAPNDSDIHHNWGVFLCSSGRAAEAIPEFEQAIHNPLYRTPEIALINAGKCSVSIGDVARGEQFFRQAITVSPNQPVAAYNLALLAFRQSKLDEARGWMRPVMQQTTPPPEALYLGMCIERKQGDRSAELSYVSQLRNRFPDSAEARALPRGVVRVTDELDPSFVEPADPPTVGEELRAAREGAGLSIQDVAQQLKLAPRQVQALEDDDYAKLPGRTFVRGFVRNYARAFGLDADDLVARLPGGEPSLERPTITPSGPPMGSLPAPVQRNWARWAIPLLLVAIVGAAGVYEMRRPQADTRRSAAPDRATAVAPVTSAGGPTTLPNPLGADAANASGAGASPSPTGGDVAPSVPPGAGDAVSSSGATPADATSAPAAAGAPSAGGAEPLLVLSFQRSSWVQVKDRNGTVLLAQNAPAGSTHAIAGPLPLDVVVGNANDVTATFRGQPVDLAPFVRGNVARLSLK